MEQQQQQQEQTADKIIVDGSAFKAFAIRASQENAGTQLAISKALGRMFDAMNNQGFPVESQVEILKESQKAFTAQEKKANRTAYTYASFIRTIHGAWMFTDAFSDEKGKVYSLDFEGMGILTLRANARKMLDNAGIESDGTPASDAQALRAQKRRDKLDATVGAKVRAEAADDESMADVRARVQAALDAAEEQAKDKSSRDSAKRYVASLVKAYGSLQGAADYINLLVDEVNTLIDKAQEEELKHATEGKPEGQEQPVEAPAQIEG